MTTLSVESPRIHLIEHPILTHKITQLRQRETPGWQVRQLLKEVGHLMTFEATRDLRVQKFPIETPDSSYTGGQINLRIGLLPILRGGLGFADGAAELFPQAEIWHIGVKNTAEGRYYEYYNGLSKQAPRLDVGIVLDPLLQTGKSARFGIQSLANHQTPIIKFIGLAADPEAMQSLCQDFPVLHFYVAYLQPAENNWMYGWGDIGDRQNNTPHV